MLPSKNTLGKLTRRAYLSVSTDCATAARRYNAHVIGFTESDAGVQLLLCPLNAVPRYLS